MYRCYRTFNTFLSDSQEEILLPDGIPEFRPEKVKDLPPTRKKVIEYMLEAGPSSWTLSAQDLGAAVGTSGVNVVRTAQALGYTKLSHLRLALSDYATSQPRQQRDPAV